MLTIAAALLLGASSSATFKSARAQGTDEYHVEIVNGQFVAGCTPFKVAGYNVRIRLSNTIARTDSLTRASLPIPLSSLSRHGSTLRQRRVPRSRSAPTFPRA